MISAIRSAGTESKAVEAAKIGMDRKEFLRVLCAELSNQNPLEPMKNAEFVSQLAQFAQIDYMDQAGKLQMACNALGKRVKLKAVDDKPPVEGIVEGISFERGQPEIRVDGKPYMLDLVLEVELTDDGKS